MNIFVLDRSPVVAARLHCDQHVTKMILESAQMFSTEARRLGSTHPLLYKPTHQNHPCSVWLRDKDEHVMWLWKLTVELSNQHKFRFDTYHKSYDVALKAVTEIGKYRKSFHYAPDDLYSLDHPLAMPDEFKDSDPVVAYREYYKAKNLQWQLDKKVAMRYTKVERPYWLVLP